MPLCNKYSDNEVNINIKIEMVKNKSGRNGPVVSRIGIDKERINNNFIIEKLFFIENIYSYFLIL